MNARGPEIVRALAPAFAVIVAGTIVTRIVLPGDAPPFAVMLRSVHRWWYLGRASGFVAYALLTGSMLLGIGVSSRVFDGLLVRPWVFEMHQFLSSFVLIAIAFHALVLLPDPYTHFNLAELLVPFCVAIPPAGYRIRHDRAVRDARRRVQLLDETLVRPDRLAHVALRELRAVRRRAGARRHRRR